MATRAKNRKPLNNIFSQANGRFQNNFTEMFLLSPFTKIAQNGSAPLNKNGQQS